MSRIKGVWLYVRVCYSHSTASCPKHSIRPATRHQYLLVLFGRNDKIPKRRQILENMPWLCFLHFPAIGIPLRLIFPNISHKKILQVFIIIYMKSWKIRKWIFQGTKTTKLLQKDQNRLRESEEVTRTHNLHVVYIIMVMVVYGNSGSSSSPQAPN